MWVAALILLSLSGEILGHEEDCKGGIQKACPSPNIPLKIPVTDEDLDEICPYILQGLKCVRDFNGKCYNDPSDWGRRIAYATEVCNKGSKLREVVLQELPCLKEIIYNLDPVCRNLSKAAKVYEGHRGGFPTDRESEEYKAYSKHRFCYYETHKTACIIAQVERQCGEVAKKLVLDANRQIDLFAAICTPEVTDDLLELIKIMEIEMSQKGLMEHILLLRKQV